jgi:TPR repeat protein
MNACRPASETPLTICDPSETSAMACNPLRSPHPLGVTNQYLRDTSADDGRIAALEAATAQHPHAAYDLALRYFRGDGVPRDSYRALSLMRAAAGQGDLNAQKALGRLYLTGLEELQRDPREARTWLSLAATQGDKESAQLLSEAEAASRSHEEDQWLRRWRPAVNFGWQSGYSYYGQWNGRAWNY